MTNKTSTTGGQSCSPISLSAHNKLEIKVWKSNRIMDLDEITTRTELAAFWNSFYPKSCKVVAFYGHAKEYKYRSFSNFYEHNEVPFTLPECCWNVFLASREGSVMPPRTVDVSFSEKSIMLCKAAVMGDYESYCKLMAVNSPGEAKKLGREVQNFDEDVWQSVILTVAFESVYQKFKGFESMEGETEELQSFYKLMETGDALIAEAAPRDFIWGMGKKAGHPNCQDPRTWRNGNVLGFALIKARNRLKDEINADTNLRSL
jgi:ribA/ribD-fused uncharacterized protein